MPTNTEVMRQAVADRPATAPQPALPARWVHLDVLRCVAIVLVLGPHTPFRLPENTVGWPLFEMWRHGGWVGVDLFFVLSGFLIGGLLFAEKRKYGSIRFGRFFVRRTFKIWPTYLLFLVAAMAFAVVYIPDKSVRMTARVGEVARATWPYLIHIQNYYETPMVERIGHAWSLAVEEHFYLLLPLLLFVLGLATSRGNSVGKPGAFRGIPWIGIGLLAGCLGLRLNAWRMHPEFDEYTHHWPTHLRIDALFAGVTLAYGVHFARPSVEKLRPFRWVILVASVACFAPFFTNIGSLVPRVDGLSRWACTYGYTLLSIGSVGMVLLAWFGSVPAQGQTGPTWLPRATPPKVLRASGVFAGALAVIGARSYSIYLFHMPFTVPIVMRIRAQIGLWDSPWHYPVMASIYAALAFALGSFMYFIIEAPSVAIRERLFPSRSHGEVPKGKGA